MTNAPNPNPRSEVTTLRQVTEYLTIPHLSGALLDMVVQSIAGLAEIGRRPREHMIETGIHIMRLIKIQTRGLSSPRHLETIPGRNNDLAIKAARKCIPLTAHVAVRTPHC
jgi:hypothetical protein